MYFWVLRVVTHFYPTAGNIVSNRFFVKHCTNNIHYTFITSSNMVKDGFNICTGGPVILYISKPVFVAEEYSKPTSRIKTRIEIHQ